MFELSFLNTGILLASLATLIPLLIHLFIKNKPLEVYFSSLKFLREIIEEKKQKMTINQLILLILRMLIILFIVFALARPVVNLPFVKKGNYHPPTAVAFILDTSPSMDYIVDQKTQLQHGIDIIKNIQNEMNSDDASILFTSDYLHNTLKSRLYYGLLPEKDMSDIDFTWTPEPMERVINQAQEELEKSRFLHKEIYVISDVAMIPPSTTNPEHQTPNTEHLAPITYITTFTDSFRINLSTDKVIIRKEPIAGTVQRIAEFEVVNHSPVAQRDQIVRLNLNGSVVAEKMIDFAPFERKTDYFVIMGEYLEWNNGFVEVRNERYIPDNRFYFSYYNDPAPRIGVFSNMGNIPLPIEVLAEIFIGENGQLVYLQQDNFQLADRHNYHFLIFYLNDFSSRIQALVSELRSSNYQCLYIIPPDLTEIAHRFLLDTFSLDITILPPTSTASLSTIHYHQWHRIVGDFDFNTNISLYVSPAVSILPTPTSVMRDGKTLVNNITLVQAANTPLIIENGDIFVNIDFSLPQNFLTYPAFPIIIYRSFSWISQYDGVLNNYTLGQAFPQRSGLLKSPSGIEFDAQNTGFRFGEPGIWQYADPSGGLAYLAVNLAPTSSGDAPLTTTTTEINYLTDDYLQKVLQTDKGSEIWKALLWAVLLFLTCEMGMVMVMQKVRS